MIRHCPRCGHGHDKWICDLFCGAGGAAEGYHRAGFGVVGVDIAPQPRYPFEFHQADALDVLAAIAEHDPFYPSWLEPVDAIHASPVCKTFTRVTAWRGRREDHPDTLTPSLRLLQRIRIPWVVENVIEACPPLRADLVLCGSRFGLDVHRRRGFQLGNWTAYELMPSCTCPGNPDLLPFEHKNERAFADAMGCTWMNKTEARQAIPPAYTAYIGGQLLEHLMAVAP